MGRFLSGARDAALSLAVTAGLVALLALGGEAYFRAVHPFLLNTDRLAYVPGLGFLYAPDTENLFTNQLDYWTRQRANAAGFLAAAPPTLPADADACRIALIGDSFVEAVQVPISEKVQTRMEEGAPARLGGRRLAVGAFGFQATGQLNQLPFYDLYARNYRPNVVVLVFVMNDFANNSALLEAIRSGFDPAFPARPYARRTAAGAIEILPPHPDWAAHLFNSTPSGAFLPRVHMWLRTHSYFYTWAFTKLSLLAPRTAAALYGFDLYEEQAKRRDALAARPDYANLLKGFSGHAADPKAVASVAVRGGAALAVDEPFSWPVLPGAFEEALAFTGFALDQFLARAQRDGAHLLILATESLRLGEPPDELRFKRLKSLADARGIPVLDLYEYLRAHGHDPRAASFPHDMHWSAAGHAWAAQALLDYIAAHPALCAPLAEKGS
ncbi:hypothetical protein [Aquabacter spiritensis]|uniref:GDSL-like lipase/acylhydrolase family protein n=1 Tax=Aquabacter spiritensis TaxID=933073 RepID=A0A4R3M1E9_9HYPH|nr:hypothetical protein [Aquabacter spiritensis]TCT06533.1 hypothetical protein EDC64_10210 [Aquabacter spiritensis]